MTAKRKADVIFDEDHLLSHVGGDKSLAEVLIANYFDARSEHLNKIEKSIEDCDSDALSESAHAFKGIVSYFSKTAAAEVLKLQEMGQEDNLIKAGEVYEVLKKMILKLEQDINEFKK